MYKRHNVSDEFCNNSKTKLKSKMTFKRTKDVKSLLVQKTSNLYSKMTFKRTKDVKSLLKNDFQTYKRRQISTQK